MVWQLVEALEGRAAAEERVVELTEELRLTSTQCTNLRSDLDTLLQVASRARTEGNWRCDDVTFICISPDQVYGAILPSSGRTTPSCGLKASISPADPHCTDPFPLIGRPSEARSSLSNVQTSEAVLSGAEEAEADGRQNSASFFSTDQVGADQAEMQLSVNIDVMAARLAEAERECEQSRLEVCQLRAEYDQSRSELCQLRAECETLRERASEAELSHECCDAAVARLHRELQEVTSAAACAHTVLYYSTGGLRTAMGGWAESLKISRELQLQISSRDASPVPPAAPANLAANSPPPAAPSADASSADTPSADTSSADTPSAGAVTARSTRDAGVTTVSALSSSETSMWDARVRVCRLENEVRLVHVWCVWCTCGVFGARVVCLVHVWCVWCTCGVSGARVVRLVHVWCVWCTCGIERHCDTHHNICSLLTTAIVHQVSEKGILVRELQSHLAAARHECCLKDVTIKKLEDKLLAVRADLCEREERRQYLEQQLVLLQRQLAHTHAQAQELARQVEQKGQLVQKLERENCSLAGQLNARAAGADTLQLTADHVAQELIVRNSELENGYDVYCVVILRVDKTSIVWSSREWTRRLLRGQLESGQDVYFVVTQQRLAIASLQDALVASKQTCDVLRAQLDEDVSRHVDPTRPVPHPHVLTTNTPRGTDVADNGRLSVNVVVGNLASDQSSLQSTDHSSDAVAHGSETVKLTSGTGRGCDVNDKIRNAGLTSTTDCSDESNKISSVDLNQQDIVSTSVNKVGWNNVECNESLSVAKAQPNNLSESPAIVSSTVMDSSIVALRSSSSSSISTEISSPDPCNSFASQVPLPGTEKLSVLSSNCNSSTFNSTEPVFTQNSTNCSNKKNSSPSSSKVSAKSKSDDLKSEVPITTQPQPLTVPTTAYESTEHGFEKSNAAIENSSVCSTNELGIRPISLNQSHGQYANRPMTSSASDTLGTNAASGQLSSVNNTSSSSCKENIDKTSKCDASVNASNDHQSERFVLSHDGQPNNNECDASVPMFQLSPLEPIGIINNNVFPFHALSMDFPAITPIYSDTRLLSNEKASEKENDGSNNKVDKKHSTDYPMVNLDDLQRCALPDYLSPDSVLNLSRVRSYHPIPGVAPSAGMIPSRPGLACDYSLPESRMLPSQGVMPVNGSTFSANSPFYSTNGVVPSDSFHPSLWKSSSGFQRPGFFKRPKDYVIPCRKPDAKQGEILDV
ncbi:hypothetical protein FHG87_008450 [Trinorchestia longiramus]|nr:hypothetical protein FHG87_008450 [Trinorchestia longiramus]